MSQIINQSPANLYVMDRPDLISTFTKIELWRQTQYKRIVYLDADMVVLRAPNELLTLDTHFAAVPDIGWPDCFNSGLLVLNPNLADYYSLLALAERGISFDGADQGLLNMHFQEWDRLSFMYNCTPSANYQYVPAYRHFQSSISVVHFIGKDKPWTLGRDNKFNTGVYGELLGHWWAVYDRHYRPPPPPPLPPPPPVRPKICRFGIVHANCFQRAAYSPGPPAPEVPRPTKVPEYVHGEEAATPSQTALPAPPAPAYEPPSPPHEGVTGPGTDQPPPETTVERPVGDTLTSTEPVSHQDFPPPPVTEQRPFSPPQVEWEPAQ